MTQLTPRSSWHVPGCPFRFTAWKVITKQLISYFEGIADIENNTAKELTKLGAVIQVPFKAGNQFLGEDGLQDVYYNIRDKTRIIADHHANLGKTIEGSIVQHLQKLHFEIKAHIKNVQNDTGKLANSVAHERELSTKHISDLARAISTYKNTPMTVTPKEDPYCQNQVVLKQLQKQVRPTLGACIIFRLMIMGTGKRRECASEVHYYHTAEFCALRRGHSSFSSICMANIR